MQLGATYFLETTGSISVKGTFLALLGNACESFKRSNIRCRNIHLKLGASLYLILPL